jgi:20S proteasome alpha/beta subunit
VTLVLAIRCREGVVLASDSQATSDAAGQPTRQPVRKLFEVGGRIAWGAAGSLGLQQALTERLAAERARVLAADDPRPALVDAVIPIQQRALRDFVPHPGAQPPDLACVFCWIEGSGAPRIFSVPRTGSDHQLHDGHAAVGTGDIFADFAMVSVAHLGTPDLSLEQAKMVALKAINDAIDVAAVYLDRPVQMTVVTPAGVRAVPRSEIEGGLSDSVDAWKVRQRETLGPLAAPAPVVRSAVAG